MPPELTGKPFGIKRHRKDADLVKARNEKLSERRILDPKSDADCSHGISVSFV